MQCCSCFQFHVVYFRSYNCDLMIFYFTGITCMYKLCTVYTGTIEFNLHIFTTDDLTFECRCECNRDIDVCDLDLDVTCFQRCCIEFAYVFLNDQALRYSCNIFCFVVITGNPSAIAPAPQATITSSRGANALTNAGTRLIVYSIRVPSITRCYVTEDQSCTKSYRYYMDNCCNVFSKRDNTYVCTCLHPASANLVRYRQPVLPGYPVPDRFNKATPSSTVGADPRITATPGISPVTSGTPSSRITASARCP